MMRAKIVLFALGFLASALLATTLPTSAQEPSAGRVREIVEAMEALPDLEGRWRGGGWMRRGPQEPQHFVSEEIVESKLGGQILLIEGIHHAQEDPSREMFHAFALLSYDPEADCYRFRSHTGEGQDSEFEARIEDGAFVWGHEARGGRIRYVIRIQEDRWEEVGEFSSDGETWRQFFEMKLDRVE